MILPQRSPSPRKHDPKTNFPFRNVDDLCLQSLISNAHAAAPDFPLLNRKRFARNAKRRRPARCTFDTTFRILRIQNQATSSPPIAPSRGQACGVIAPCCQTLRR